MGLGHVHGGLEFISGILLCGPSAVARPNWLMPFPTRLVCRFTRFLQLRSFPHTISANKKFTLLSF